MTSDEIVEELRAAIKRRLERMDEGPDLTRLEPMDRSTFNAIHSGAIAGMYYAISLITEGD